MRISAVNDCKQILAEFRIDPSAANAIDVGGTATVYLDSGFAPNPLFTMSPNLTLLDGGFNVDVIGTQADNVTDFLQPGSIEALKDRFDMVYCFDTMEHVSNPFRFAEHLLAITKPGGYLYVCTVFEWPYHPSPQDYYRFSPMGLKELFENELNALRDEQEILWYGWGSDRRGVASLIRRRGGEAPDNGGKIKRDEYFLNRSTAAPGSSESGGVTERTSRFLKKPLKAKVESVRYHAGNLKKRIPRFKMATPVRLAGGPLMLAWPDVMGTNLKTGDYEKSERLFISRFLKPGMTFFDVGAHNGYYSLLAAHQMGNTGRIVAFEPSTRERRRLQWNLLLNRFRSVTVERFALGDTQGESSLFVVRGKETGCNSLRPPDVDEPIQKKTVAVQTLDNYVTQNRINYIDFLKLDVEGAELSVLKGAAQLLNNKPRPVVMCELVDIRTAPWNYKASEVYDLLASHGFEWFSFNEDGSLLPAPRKEHFHENLIAIPSERLPFVSNLLAP